MKIAIPIFGFAASGGGRVLSELANQWISMGHEVTFISFGDSISPYFPTQANIIWVDYKLNKITSNNLKKKNYPYRYFFIRHKLTEAIEKFASNCDIILATHCFTALPVSLAKVKAKKFYYIQAHETEYYSKGGLKHWFYKQAAKSSYKYNLKRIVNCELYLDYKEIQADMFVYPGIDLDIYFPKKSRIENTDQKLILGCIGRVQKIKGTHLVLEAFRTLRQKYGQIELHIAFGNKDLADEEGIKILQPNGDKELAQFYRSVDVIIAPGTVQLGAIHYPVLEAFASGTSVITTGYSKANSTNSYIVPINDSKSIAKTVEEIIKSPVKANKKAEIAKTIPLNFEWSKVSIKMLNYFKNSIR